MDISLVIPCYNEETNIQKGVLDKIGNYAAEHSDIKEVLIVDDGSTDLSKKLIKNQYLKKFTKFKLFENEHMGKAFAIITGIKKSAGSYVMFTDIDLATPIEEADKLINAADAADIIVGSRSAARQGAPILRKLMAFGFIVVRNIILGLRGIKDTQCGFKLFKRQAALDIISRLCVFVSGHSLKGSSVSAGFDLEFLFVALKRGYKIREIPVTWKHVETKNVNFFKDSFEGLRDILYIKFFDLAGKYSKKS